METVDLRNPDEIADAIVDVLRHRAIEASGNIASLIDGAMDVARREGAVTVEKKQRWIDTLLGEAKTLSLELSSARSDIEVLEGVRGDLEEQIGEMRGALRDAIDRADEKAKYAAELERVVGRLKGEIGATKEILSDIRDALDLEEGESVTKAVRDMVAELDGALGDVVRLRGARTDAYAEGYADATADLKAAQRAGFLRAADVLDALADASQGTTRSRYYAHAAVDLRWELDGNDVPGAWKAREDEPEEDADRWADTPKPLPGVRYREGIGDIQLVVDEKTEHDGKVMSLFSDGSYGVHPADGCHYRPATPAEIAEFRQRFAEEGTRFGPLFIYGERSRNTYRVLEQGQHRPKVRNVHGAEWKWSPEPFRPATIEEIENFLHRRHKRANG